MWGGGVWGGGGGAQMIRKQKDVGEQEERSPCGHRGGGEGEKERVGSGMKFEGQTFD